MHHPASFQSVQRINVVGTSGSGKSTFGKKLAAILQAPYLEIDNIFWGPDWTYLNDEALFKKLEIELSVEKWVLDGNYHRTIPVKWKNVQMVIWLDYSIWRIILRVVKRTIWRSVKGIEIWKGTGNKESFNKMFSADSMILWSLKTYRANRVKYHRDMHDSNYAHIIFVRLSNPKEAEKFLREMKSVH